MEKKKCCICGKEFEGWGNNPSGALNEKGEVIEWKIDDYCCDVCNYDVVLKGRIMLLNRGRINKGV